MKNSKTFILVMSFMTLAVAGQSQSWQSKISESLWSKQQEPSIEFFVYLKNQANLEAAKLIKNKNEKGNFVYDKLYQTAIESQAELVEILEGDQIFYQSFWVVNGIWVKGDFALIQKMAMRAEVAHIFFNSPIKGESPVETERNPILSSRDSLAWGISKIKANQVWAMGYEGQGVVVGGQDTGYGWEVPGIKSKYRGWDGTTANHNYSWHDAIHNWHPLNSDTISPCGLNALVPCDDNGHGTHTIGTMVASDDVVSFGVAPAAQWIGCRNMERGWGSAQSYIECFEWFLAPTDLNNQNADPSKAPHVINNSWSCPEEEGCDSSNFVLLEQAVNNLKLAGVVVVVSAGNSGPDCHSVSTPSAIFEQSFSVGALNINDTIANFSSRGSVTVDGSNRLKPNVTAPGVGITSYTTIGDGTGNWYYANYNGTSMAGPHVAGLVALMISADTTLAGDVNRIEDIIEQTAIGHTTGQNCGGISGLSIPNNTYGYGVVNALGAVNQAINTAHTTGIKPAAQAVVFPNPTLDYLWVKLDGFSGKTNFDLYSVDGKLVRQMVWEVSWNTLREVSLANLPTGLYFYKIYDQTTQTQGKIVKQ